MRATYASSGIFLSGPPDSNEGQYVFGEEHKINVYVTNVAGVPTAEIPAGKSLPVTPTFEIPKDDEIGSVHVFDLTQSDRDGQVIGGTRIIAVTVPEEFAEPVV